MGFITQANYHAQAVAAQNAAEEARKAALAPSQLVSSQAEAKNKREYGCNWRGVPVEQQSLGAYLKDASLDKAVPLENGMQLPFSHGKPSNLPPWRSWAICSGRWFWANSYSW